MWEEGRNRWVASYYLNKKHFFQRFKVNKYMKPGVSQEDANQQALNEAIDFRHNMEESGKIKVHSTRPKMRGVSYNAVGKYWGAQLMVKKKQIHGPHRRPKDDTKEEDERAWKLACEDRL